MLSKIVYNIKIASLCLFAFSLGIEYWDPFGIRHIFTITKFSGVLYFVLSLYEIRKNLNISKNNKTLVYSSVFLWFWITLVSLFSTATKGGEVFLFFSTLQAILLYWMVFNDILNNPRIKQYVFLSIVLGLFLVSILLSFGIGVEGIGGNEIDNIDGARVYFMGMNPNRMGDLAAIATLIVFSLIFSRENTKKIRFLLLLGIPSLLTVIGISGSRGSFVLIFLGLSIFFLLRKTSAFNKIIFIFIGLMSGLLIMQFMTNFGTLQERLTNTYESGDVGGRFEIWKCVLEVIKQNPIFGSGLRGYQLSIAQEYGSVVDPHNLFLYVWVVGGLIALLAILIIFIRTFKNTLTSLKLHNDTTNLMIFMAVVFIASKSGGAIELKTMWLLLACVGPIKYKHTLKKF